MPVYHKDHLLSVGGRKDVWPVKISVLVCWYWGSDILVLAYQVVLAVK